ncbi:MAG: tetratricopeptide repeat protein [Gimesia sp.]
MFQSARFSIFILIVQFCATSLLFCGCQALSVSNSAIVSKLARDVKPADPISEPSKNNSNSSPYNAQVNEIVQQALDHYSKGDLNQAKILLASAHEIDPGHIGTFEIEAQLSYDMGDQRKYLQSLRAIRAASPHDSKKLSAVGTLFFQAGQTQEGIDCLKRAIELKPYDEDYALKLAAFYEQTGRTDDAHQVLLRSLHGSPGSRRLPIALGRLCEVNQKWKHASVYYAIVVNHFPKNHIWRKQHARCLYYSGDYSAAFEEFLICQKNDPESLSLSEMIAFGDSALQLQKLDQAQQIFDKISMAHQHQLLHVEILRGLCAINRGQVVSANTIINTARTKWPADPTLLQVAALLPSK